MSTQVQTPEAPAPAPKARRERKSFSVRFDGPNAAMLRIVLRLKKDGTATTHAVQTTREGKKRINTRGATEQHDSPEVARAALDRLVNQALKLGWVRRQRLGRFTAKPDAFTPANLPAPPKAKK